MIGRCCCPLWRWRPRSPPSPRGGSVVSRGGLKVAEVDVGDAQAGGGRDRAPAPRHAALRVKPLDREGAGIVHGRNEPRRPPAVEQHALRRASAAERDCPVHGQLLPAEVDGIRSLCENAQDLAVRGVVEGELSGGVSG